MQRLSSDAVGTASGATDAAMLGLGAEEAAVAEAVAEDGDAGDAAAATAAAAALPPSKRHCNVQPCDGSDADAAGNGGATQQQQQPAATATDSAAATNTTAGAGAAATGPLRPGVTSSSNEPSPTMEVTLCGPSPHPDEELWKPSDAQRMAPGATRRPGPGEEGRSSITPLVAELPPGAGRPPRPHAARASTGSSAGGAGAGAADALAACGGVDGALASLASLAGSSALPAPPAAAAPGAAAEAATQGAASADEPMAADGAPAAPPPPPQEQQQAAQGAAAEQQQLCAVPSVASLAPSASQALPPALGALTLAPAASQQQPTPPGSSDASASTHQEPPAAVAPASTAPAAQPASSAGAPTSAAAQQQLLSQLQSTLGLIAKLLPGPGGQARPGSSGDGGGRVAPALPQAAPSAALVVGGAATAAVERGGAGVGAVGSLTNNSNPALRAVQGLAWLENLPDPFSPPVVKAPRARRPEVEGFKWPDEPGPLIPPVEHEDFYLPREWLVARPPRFELIKRCMWVSRPKPRRLANKDDDNVCMCKAPAPGARPAHGIHCRAW